MTCPRCGGENVSVQVMQENRGSTSVTKTKATYKQKKHGLLWWLFIGWWWWIFDLVIWIVAFLPRLAFGLLRKKKYTKNEVSTTKTRQNNVTYKLCVCQSCGNSWRV